MSEQVYKFRVPAAKMPGWEVVMHVIASSEEEAQQRYKDGKIAWSDYSAIGKEEVDMDDNEIKELKAVYDRLVLQFADAQMKACRLSGERERAKNALIAKLQELFRSTNDYNGPYCGKPMNVEYSQDGKCWMECSNYDCQTEGPEFDGPLEAYLEWYRICNNRKKVFYGEEE